MKTYKYASKRTPDLQAFTQTNFEHLKSAQVPNTEMSPSEEIPVVGYASADDNSAMQVLNGSMHRSASPFDGFLLSDCSQMNDAALGTDTTFCIHQSTLKGDSKIRDPVSYPVESDAELQKTVHENAEYLPNNQSGLSGEVINSPSQLLRAQINICATAKPSRSLVPPVNEHRKIRGSKSLDGYIDHLNVKDGDELQNLRKDTSDGCGSELETDWDGLKSAASAVNESSRSKRNSMTSDLGMCGRFVVDLDEPIHMTLEEVRSSLHNIKGMLEATSATLPSDRRISCARWNQSSSGDNHGKANVKLWGKRMHFGLCLKSKQTDTEHRLENDHIRCLPKSFKHTLYHWLGIGKVPSNQSSSSFPEDRFRTKSSGSSEVNQAASFVNRALPPVPQENQGLDTGLSEFNETVADSNHHWDEQESLDPQKAEDIVPDFAASIQKVKDCGWYWGPISGEMAEKILVNEPDGSFIVRDSSDEHYIFSLTFKLNGFVRHVRIEHDQGNFSFGTYTIFKSHTIVEFIENAVQHSRSGRYLFFLHRRPILGPMRVQLLHPVSRFKKVQSLQHMCRFIILKAVRRDLIDGLPLPARLKHYLNTPQYYAEQMQDWQGPLFNGLATNSIYRATEN